MLAHIWATLMKTQLWQLNQSRKVFAVIEIFFLKIIKNSQKIRETWAHRPSPQLTSVGMDERLNGGQNHWWKHGTDLNVEDFESVDGEHQAEHHFVSLFSKGTWEVVFLFTEFT